MTSLYNYETSKVISKAVMHVMGTCGVISHHDGLMDSMHDRGSRHLSMFES